MIARGSEIATNIYMTILWRDLLSALIEGGNNWKVGVVAGTTKWPSKNICRLRISCHSAASFDMTMEFVHFLAPLGHTKYHKNHSLDLFWHEIIARHWERHFLFSSWIATLSEEILSGRANPEISISCLLLLRRWMNIRRAEFQLFTQLPHRLPSKICRKNMIPTLREDAGI
jgi:hypothetical protein